MASNPYFSPLHTQRFSFIGSPQQRDGTFLKDQRFLNMYPELIKSDMTDGKKYYLKKRPGITDIVTIAAPGNARGIYYWNGLVFTAIDGGLYRNGTLINNLTTTTGPVGFTEYRTDSINVLVVVDGVHGYTIQPGGTGAVTQISSANFPTPHVPTPIFMDGYIFLASIGSQTIHNSDLGNPLNWSSDGFLDAEMYPDNIQSLVINNNYIAAVGVTSIEWFYDNANATGSPLQRNAPAVSQFGTPAPNSVNQTEKEVILVGSTQVGGRTVWVIDGFQPTEIASEPVREALDALGSNINLVSAMTLQCAGHKWYILNMPSANRTFVYDFDEKMWHEWSSGPTGEQVFQWLYCTDSAIGSPLVMNYQGQIAFLSPTAYDDEASAISITVTTSKIDFDTIMRKRFFRLSLTTDSPNNNIPTPMVIQWSDDDYTTWSAGHTIMIDGGYPTITQLGIGRRRAFKFTYNQPYPLRMESFELDVTQEQRK